MHIKALEVRNFKSLQQFMLRPTPMTVIVGANGSGKSNVAECLDFLSETYQHGMQIAIARKGGYENIAYRRLRRAKGAIEFAVTASFDSIRNGLPPSFQEASSSRRFEVKHAFGIRARSESIRASFEVSYESLSVYAFGPGGERHWLGTLEKGGLAPTIALPERDELERVFGPLGHDFDGIFGMFDIGKLVTQLSQLQSNELLTTVIGKIFEPLSSFVTAMSGLRLLQVNPMAARQPGVATPNALLGRHGENLPAVVDRLQEEFPEQWQRMVEIMRHVLPQLSAVDVKFNSGRTLELAFQEKGFGRSWNQGEVSEGTIQILALLVGVLDPRGTGLVIEEPENSVHPWIIREFVDVCTQIAAEKQIVLTTHSPIVVNHVDPRNVFVVSRRHGATLTRRLTELDPEHVERWNEGSMATFELLDSGVIPEAVPPQMELFEADLDDPEESP
jgi:predicted ATPase